MPTQPPRFGARSTPRKPWQPAEGTKDRRLRGRAGVKQREQVRREEPFCRKCLEAGLQVATDEIDHIRPLALGGGNERSNLQGLCTPCHDAKSREDRARGHG